jgi:hypothetical protein
MNTTAKGRGLGETSKVALNLSNARKLRICPQPVRLRPEMVCETQARKEVKGRRGNKGGGAGGSGNDSGSRKLVLPSRPRIVSGNSTSKLAVVPEHTFLELSSGEKSSTGGSEAGHGTSGGVSVKTTTVGGTNTTSSTVPPKGTPIALVTTPGADVSGGSTVPPAFYVVGSVYNTFNITTDIAPLKKGSDLDTFINLLEAGYVTLVAGPGKLFEDGLQLSANDPFMQILLSNGLGIQGLTMAGSVDATNATFSAVTATVSFGGHAMTFSSTASSRFSLVPSVVPAPATPTKLPQLSDAFVPDYNILALGLVPDTTSASTSLSVVDLLTTFEIPWLTPATGLLPGFGSELS